MNRKSLYTIYNHRHKFQIGFSGVIQHGLKAYIEYYINIKIINNISLTGCNCPKIALKSLK